jgi:hypothetical protein
MVTLTRSPRPDPTRTEAGRTWLAEHRSLVVLVAVLLGLGLGGIGYLLLSAPDDTVSLDAGTLARASRSATPGGTATSPTARTTSSTSRSTSASGPSRGTTGTTGTNGSTGTTGRTGATGTSGRNPFGGVGQNVVAPTAGATGGTGVTGTGGAAPSGPGTGTPVVSVTTTTVTASVVYLGLYDWTSDGRPMFRLNEKAVTPAAGATIAPGLVYKGSFTSKASRCANLTVGGKATSLCLGEVTKVG